MAEPESGKQLLRSIETYCTNRSCGDSVQTVGGGGLQHSKRRMVLARVTWTGWSAVYRCPECSRERRFRRLFWSTGTKETTEQGVTQTAPST